MSLTQSTMLPLGSPAPDFSLPATDGRTVSLRDFNEARALVVLFICNHCPYVIHIAPALAALARKYQAQGIQFVAINSNDTDAYPADSFELMAVEKAKRDYPFPYLFDQSQDVAKAYKAACTPDLFVFDDARRLSYRGQFDGTRPQRISSGNYHSSASPATGDDLSKALDLILAAKPVPQEQHPAMGCNIKWRE
jgi:peroxiredoxin